MKYFIDEVIVFNGGDEMRGFYLIVDDRQNKAMLEIPSDVYGDDSILYNEEIPLDQETFQVKYETGVNVHIKDGELIGELIK